MCLKLPRRRTIGVLDSAKQRSPMPVLAIFVTSLSLSVHYGFATTPVTTLSNGVKMPLVACGTGGDSVANAKTDVKIALTAGFSHIDTAHDYGCIKGVGEAFAEWNADHPGAREHLFLTSKVPGCGVPTQVPLSLKHAITIYRSRMHGI